MRSKIGPDIDQLKFNRLANEPSLEGDQSSEPITSVAVDNDRMDLWNIGRSSVKARIGGRKGFRKIKRKEAS
jgi:hypothetical protein